MTNLAHPGHAPAVLETAGPLTRALAVACLVAAGSLLVANVVRLATTVGLRWWMPLVRQFVHPFHANQPDPPETTS